ncbi:MAG: hypothetical protein A2655_00930 [Candidatus Yanofskybacteria bacterium RIFCSPHIGHO2_01_FULL_43_42]|nr:MAG: hypothetical protein A2655_00930 [Candidatus Yanofskybacteria bacterium RIFCSPHIGHO2_01_FULL_43_42]
MKLEFLGKSGYSSGRASLEIVRMTPENESDQKLIKDLMERKLIWNHQSTNKDRSICVSADVSMQIIP